MEGIERPILALPTSAGSPESRLDSAIEAEEFVHYRTKVRAATTFGFFVYLSFLTTDYLITELSDLHFWEVARVRLLVQLFLVPPILAIRFLDLSRDQFRLAEGFAFSAASAGVALMCIPTGGLESVYFAGVMLTIVSRAAFVSEHWKATLLPTAAILLPYPLVLTGASFFVPQVAAQFGQQRSVYLFLMQNSFVLCTGVLSAWAGHQVWGLRRKVYESRALGRYRLDQRIGSGGMGEVWSATHPRLRRKVAVKILQSAPQGIDAQRRFEAEFAATSQLSHPNTVRVFDYGATDDGILYYVMELLDGEPLSRLLRRESYVNPARALHLVDQAARALGEAHGHGICHRDVKPDNLFIKWSGDDGDFVKVLDFGVAKQYGQQGHTDLTHTGIVIGTPDYISPEVAAGRPADARSDVYALGVVLYQCLTGRTPFEGQNPAAIIASQISALPPLPSSVAKQAIPFDVEQVVMRCLEKDPGARFADGSCLAAAISSCGEFGKWRPGPAEHPPSTRVGSSSLEPTTQVENACPDSAALEVRDSAARGSL